MWRFTFYIACYTIERDQSSPKTQTSKGQMGTNGIDFAKSEKEGKSTKVAFAAGVERGERLGRKIPPAPCKIIF